MGGRGSSGGGGGGGGGTPKLQELTGSEKQVAWANDIRQGAFNQLDAMDANYDRLRSVAQQEVGAKRGPKVEAAAESLAGYNKSDVQAGREALIKAFNSPQAKSASAVIDKRNDFSPRSVSQAVRSRAEQRKRK